MNFYGVGVKFGGTDDMLPLFLKKDCWFMGWGEQEKPNMAKTISEIKIGDILIAKAYANVAQHDYFIRAIGIVTSTNKPGDIPEEYQNKSGVSVIWMKHFEKPIALLASKYRRGTFHISTIFHETNENMISTIKNMMRFDYIGKTNEDFTENTESSTPYNIPVEILTDDYIETARTLILDELYGRYDVDEIFVYPCDDIEIADEDQFGRKIICVPFAAEGIKKYGLVLLAPEKDCQDDKMSLADREIVLLDNKEDIVKSIMRLKIKIDWNKKINY